MCDAHDVDPLSDGAGAKGGVDLFDGSFGEDSLSSCRALIDDNHTLTRMVQQQRQSRREQRIRFRELRESFVRLH